MLIKRNDNEVKTWPKCQNYIQNPPPHNLSISTFFSCSRILDISAKITNVYYNYQCGTNVN